MAGFELYAPRLAKHRRTWTAAALVLSVVFIVLGMMPVAIVAMAYKISLQPGVNWTSDCFQLYGFGAISLLLILWVVVFERRGLDSIGFNGQGVKRYLRGLGLGFVFLATVVGLIALLGGYRIQGAGFWAAPGVATLIPLLALFGGFMVQGATEEIAMRGYLLQIVASRHGLIWGTVANMIVFSILHAGNIKPSPELAVGLLNIVLVGVFFSFYAMRERSLWGVCGWHTAWNWLLGVGFGLEVSGAKLDAAPIVVDLMDRAGAPWWLTGGKFGPEGSLVASLVLGAGIAYQVWKGLPKREDSFPVLAADKAEGHF